MRDKDIEPDFSWTIAFFVTGICFLIFSGFLKLLNNHLPPVFLWVGIISLAFGCISGAVSFFDKT